MKKLIMLSLLLVVVFHQSRSQGWEGTVKWSMKMDITDPKMKAQMAEAEAKMKDPATQAQMKAAMEQMNDPKMKAMMDANPQLKAQMESTMKMMQGGSVNSMVPNGMTMKFKNGDFLSMINGGMMDGMETLYQKSKNQSVKLDRKNKTYSVLSTGNNPNAGEMKQSDVKFTKTSETMKILGYTCTKYIATLTDNKKTVNESFWTTTELKDIDLKGLSSQRVGTRTMIPNGLEGVPLRIEMSMPEGNMIIEMTELKKEALPSSDFVIPSDYKEVKMTGMMR